MRLPASVLLRILGPILADCDIRRDLFCRHHLQGVLKGGGSPAMDLLVFSTAVVDLHVDRVRIVQGEVDYLVPAARPGPERIPGDAAAGSTEHHVVRRVLSLSVSQ